MKRSEYIGGADASVILGRNGFDSLLKTFNKKVGIEFDDPTNYHMARGNFTEPLIEQYVRENLDDQMNSRRIYEYLSPHKLEAYDEAKANGDYPPQLEVVHPDYPFVGGHPDGIGRYVWEMKAPSPVNMDRILTFGISDSWVVQTQHYMWIEWNIRRKLKPTAKPKHGRVAVWDYELWAPRLYKLKPDLRLFKAFDTIYPAFWFHVEFGITPLIEGFEDQIVMVSDENLDKYLAEYVEANELAKKYDADKKALKSLIATYSGGREIYATDQHHVRLTTVDRKTHSYTQLFVKPRRLEEHTDETEKPQGEN